MTKHIHIHIHRRVADRKVKDAGEFKEGDHPRAENGQFGSGGGGSSSGGAQRKELSPEKKKIIQEWNSSIASKGFGRHMKIDPSNVSGSLGVIIASHNNGKRYINNALKRLEAGDLSNEGRADINYIGTGLPRELKVRKGSSPEELKRTAEALKGLLAKEEKNISEFSKLKAALAD